MTIASVLPATELLDTLLPAFQPCANFKGACSGLARWAPRQGHVPRGFLGAFGRLADVELILVKAEPGDPLVHERYAVGDLRSMVDDVCRAAYGRLSDPQTQYHANVRYILDRCWPGLALAEQLVKTWITNSYLCSARREGGPVPAGAVRACGNDYLLPQLALLPDRLVVALGSKAWRRLAHAPREVLRARAVTPPGCNRADARASWDHIATVLRQSVRPRAEGRGEPGHGPRRAGAGAAGGNPTRVAVVYETTQDGDQVVAGRIRIINGKLVGDPADNSSVRFILSRAAVRHDTDEDVVVSRDDPEAFLAALPAAYTGTMIRVGLEPAR